MLPIFIATLFLAYVNGANDNFKGAATLFGSGTADYRTALGWATGMTFLGSLTAFFLAQNLIQTFSGRGLIPDVLIGEPAFLLSVVLGASLTVMAAAQRGIPISTTHSLIGALAGTGWAAVGSGLEWGTLGQSFFLPLLVSPFLAAALTFFTYVICRRIESPLKIPREVCVCIGEEALPAVQTAASEGAMAFTQTAPLRVMVGEKKSCEALAPSFAVFHRLGLKARTALDLLHFLSAGAVSFARGLNDTPKIVALSLAAGALGLKWNVAGVALAMALGGILSARRVAETISHRITAMNHGEGFAANLVTACLVIFASHLGFPVSTTHVSCGALFGIGLVSGRAEGGTIRNILSAWFLTLPLAALLSGVCFWVMK